MGIKEDLHQTRYGYLTLHEAITWLAGNEQVTENDAVTWLLKCGVADKIGAYRIGAALSLRPVSETDGDTEIFNILVDWTSEEWVEYFCGANEDLHSYAWKRDAFAGFVKSNGVELSESATPVSHGEAEQCITVVRDSINLASDGAVRSDLHEQMAGPKQELELKKPAWHRAYKNRKKVSLDVAASILAGIDPDVTIVLDGEDAIEFLRWRKALIDGIDHFPLEASTWGMDRGEQLLSHDDIKAWAIATDAPWPFIANTPAPDPSASARALAKSQADLQEAREKIAAYEALVVCTDGNYQAYEEDIAIANTVAEKAKELALQFEAVTAERDALRGQLEASKAATCDSQDIHRSLANDFTEDCKKCVELVAALDNEKLKTDYYEGEINTEIARADRLVFEMRGLRAELNDLRKQLNQHNPADWVAIYRKRSKGFDATLKVIESELLEITPGREPKKIHLQQRLSDECKALGIADVENTGRKAQGIISLIYPDSPI